MRDIRGITRTDMLIKMPILPSLFQTKQGKQTVSDSANECQRKKHTEKHTAQAAAAKAPPSFVPKTNTKSQM